MYLPLELFVGLRYTRARRRNGFISLISFISILCIILGVMTLIIVLSVMNGFEKEVRERILNMIAHITVSNFEGQLTQWPQVIAQVRKNPAVVGAAPYVQAEGMLINRNNVRGAIFRGIDPTQEQAVSKVAEHMTAGKLENLHPGEFGIILGHNLAQTLGVDLGDKVTVVTPSANITPAGVMPRLKRFTVVGIFQVNYYEYDSAVGLINLDDARRVFQLGDNVSGIQVQVQNLLQVNSVTQSLREQLPDYWVRDWSYYHANWFKAVKMEKTMISLLLFLVILVAAINIISTLVMVVTEKRSDIAILRTFGAPTATIMRIFIVQGSIIGIAGTLLGGITGVVIALNIESMYHWVGTHWGFQPIDPSVYLIPDLPSDLHWDQVIYICTASLITSIVATILPALRASRTQPADALRYE
ncbi:MAG: lipoprotein-releasing ABC transporter permease subunit [Gammaproteobacteria bacterium]|nr:lipoprotein-releasing ABC transporter permease subunit [Gammaproteobacteria bacterium]